jgi:hypothetical protein
MSLVDDIKTQVKKSGANKGKFIYFRPGVKVRIRFLQDMKEGQKIPFHDSFALGVNVPCQEFFERTCPHCDREDLRHRDQYAWSVFDYEAKEVRILMGAANNVSPIPALVGMYDAYKTLTDRDYVITKNGTGQGATFSVVPMDKVKFRNEKAKPFSETKFKELLDKAFPDEDSAEDDDDESEDETPKQRKARLKKEKEAKEKKAKKGKGKKEEDDEEEDDDDIDYTDMSSRELYSLCKERDIEVKPKKEKEYYIEKLVEWDEEHDEESEDDDDW